MLVDFFQALGNALMGLGAAPLNGHVTSTGNVLVNPHMLLDVARFKSAADVLFVGKNEDGQVEEAVLLLHQLYELCCALLQTPHIRRIHDVNEGIAILEVVAPISADRLLAADVPHVQLHVLVLDALHVESLGWHHIFMVFPALSRPSMRIRISRSSFLIPFNKLSNPIAS